MSTQPDFQNDSQPETTHGEDQGDLRLRELTDAEIKAVAGGGLPSQPIPHDS